LPIVGSARTRAGRPDRIALTVFAPVRSTA
jgi:hypothetical protein